MIIHETSGKVDVIDKGALDCTIKARVECAVLRSNDASAENVSWNFEKNPNIDGRKARRKA